MDAVQALERTLVLADGLGRYNSADEAASFIKQVLPEEFATDAAGIVTVKGWAEALEAAAAAHHAYEEALGEGRDEHWATYYASFALQWLSR